MLTHVESNACNACAKSKRKCGRQLPSCARCADRGRSCSYPQSRSRVGRSSQSLHSEASRGSVSIVENRLLDVATEYVSSVTTSLTPADDLMLDLAPSLLDDDFAAPLSLITTASVATTKADWFLAPETWRIFRRDPLAPMPVGKATMKNYVAVLRTWNERWVTTGSNPFIHHCLYKANSPACIQVAYATLASYIYRTPGNTDTVLQIVEDRSNDLLRENGATLESVDIDVWADGGEQDVGLLAQLTRVHALMVYQVIGLFDGDIRSRHVAEGHMAVLDSWARKLFHSAAKALSGTDAVATHLIGYLPIPSTHSQQQWYLWILSESVRRTWLIAASLCPVFSALQQLWAPCPGGVMYTNRSGLWNAASATEWEKQCLEKNVAFLQRFDCARLLDDMVPADIDAFGMAMLDMTCNEESVEKWRDRSGVL